MKQVTWAGGGHIPAYLPFKKARPTEAMSPNNQYSAGAAKNVVFEPGIPIFGVGSPSFGAISNFLIPAIDGQLPVDKGFTQFIGELQKFAKQQQ